MTDLRKAAEMALAKLDHLWEIAVDERMGTDVLPEIKALRQALAMERFSEVNQEIEEALKQPEQERVIEITRQFVGVKEDGSERWVETEYRTTTKNEWVGLTDEEIYEHEWWDEETAFAVNKELKEKNT